MSALELKLTTAGYAAFVNPENTGTNAVVVASIGLTAQAFTPSAELTALPGEFKRVSTIAGKSIADNVIHVTMIDTTADEYEVRGFSAYDQNETMLWVYGDPDAGNLIFEKSELSYGGMSADVAFVDPIAAEVVFGDVSFINPPASETVLGVSRRSTLPQAVAGTSTDTSMTPQGDKAALDRRLGEGAPTAFVKALLNLATAALFRAEIGVKDVATLNMGSNGGIDADKLDGKHATEFAASAHSHAVGSIAGLQLELDAKAPSVHSHTIAQIMGLQAALDAKAPSASPELTGTPVAPTAAPGTNTTQLATTEFVQAAIADALANYLPKNNPTFTGTMTGPNYNKPV